MLLNKQIPFYYILNKIKVDVIYVFFISLCAYMFTTSFREFLPPMPLTIPAFIGTSITILLSFKLNQSYDRWWEARKIWGSIVNDSRSFVLQLQALTLPGNEAAIKRMGYRQIAWCYSLGQTLRGTDPMDRLSEFLSAEELEKISTHRNKPLAILQLNEFELAKLKVEKQLELFSQIQINSTIVRLCDSMGRAERIKSTIFPTTYRLYLHFMIYVFIISLDIALNSIPLYFEIPLLMVISGTFFLLEKSATHMQDPFENKPTDTAMTAIARTIEINIRQLLNETTVPEPHQPNKFYLT